MTQIPSPVISDLTSLVAEIKGKDTIISTHKILDRVDETIHPEAATWIGDHEHNRIIRLCAALRKAGYEPHTKKRGGYVLSWKVTV